MYLNPSWTLFLASSAIIFSTVICESFTVTIPEEAEDGSGSGESEDQQSLGNLPSFVPNKICKNNSDCSSVNNERCIEHLCRCKFGYLFRQNPPLIATEEEPTDRESVIDARCEFLHCKSDTECEQYFGDNVECIEQRCACTGMMPMVYLDPINQRCVLNNSTKASDNLVMDKLEEMNQYNGTVTNSTNSSSEHFAVKASAVIANLICLGMFLLFNL